MKVCYIDVETTGLKPVENDIIQIAGIIEIDGQVEETFEFKCQPHSWTTISPKALEVHGYGVEKLREFDEPLIVKTQVESILSRYINKFDKTDKFIFAGYNAQFDYNFMREWWKKAGDKWFASFFEYKVYDIYPLFQTYARAIHLELPNHKLVTAAAHFDIHLDAHDALADITVTREIGLRIESMLRAGYYEATKELKVDPQDQIDPEGSPE
jgi:DNA polymerase-3 subunit epsilon